MIYDLCIALFAVGCVGGVCHVDQLFVRQGLADRLEYRKPADPGIKYPYWLILYQGMVKTTLPMV